MPRLTWKLFDITISEETAETEKQNNFNENSDFPSDVFNEYNYSISDIIQNVFYTDSLKQIYTTNNYIESSEEYVNRLNSFDNNLSFFFNRSKEILNQLEFSYNDISSTSNNELEESIYHYTDSIYSYIKHSDTSGENSYSLEENLHSMEADIRSFLPVELHIPLETYYSELWTLIRDIDTSEESNRVLAFSKIYAKIRQLPRYLGQPYSDRYNLYIQLLKYPKYPKRIALFKSIMMPGHNPHAKIIYALTNSTLFDDYFHDSYSAIVTNIEKTQEKVCTIDTIISNDLFKNAIADLAKAIHTSSKKMRFSYSSTGTRCFSIIDLHTSACTYELICFSGVYDSAIPSITSIFPENRPLNDAISKIMSSTRFSSSILIRTNPDIRYYYAPKSFITLYDIQQSVTSGFKQLGRMFSCCERKFYSIIHTYSLVSDYHMFTKFAPCEICTDAINDYNAIYKGKIIYGQNNNKLVKCKSKYDKLAIKVASGVTGISFSCTL